MKYITLLLLVSIGITTKAQSPSHNFGPGCRYSKNFRANSEAGCAGCRKEDDEKTVAMQEERKREADIAAESDRKEAERIRQEKAARDLRAKIEEDKRKQKEQAEKDYQDFKTNREKYFREAKIETGKYPGYDPGKANTLIPEKVKGVVLFDNRNARQYEIKRGNDIVKICPWNGYTLRLLRDNLPFIIVQDDAKKKNNLSLLDNRGGLMKIGEEMYFQSIKLVLESNTIEFIIQLTEKEELIFSMDGGVYKSESHARAVENLIKMEGAEIIAKRKAAGDNTTYIAGFGSRYGFSAKRIVTGLDLSILDNRSVYVVQ